MFNQLCNFNDLDPELHQTATKLVCFERSGAIYAILSRVLQREHN
jgi:hypothetical protein